jgi:conserved hypothetical protein
MIIKFRRQKNDKQICGNNKKEKGYNIIKCPEIGITIKVQEEISLSFIEQEISNYLVDKIIKDEKIPEGIKDLKIQKALKDETIFIISIDLELELVKRRKRFIKKTVTIPEYLNILGMREDLNFSQILAEGLREKLKVK